MKIWGLLLGCIMFVGGVRAAAIVDVSLLEKESLKPIASLGQIEEIARNTQRQFWQLIPPVDDPLYIHPDGIVRAVDWDSKAWPKTVLKQMTAEMGTAGLSRSMYPFYRVTVVEMRTGELVYYNGDQEVWRAPAPLDYNPYLFAFEQYGVESEKELTAQQKIFGRSSNIGLEILLLPEVFLDSYEEDVALEAQVLAAAMVPMAMMMSGGSVTGLQMGISGTTNGWVEIEVEWPGSFANRIVLFSCADLVAGDWSVLADRLPTYNVSSLVFEDVAASNLTARFYRAGDADLDSDGDFLPDSFELVVSRSLTNSASSDGGQVPDGYEVAMSLDPNDPGDDAAALAAYLAAADDPDGDSAPDWVESREGTNPQDRFD